MKILLTFQKYIPDPCCLKANVWFDFKDLLFFSLNNDPIPSYQLKTFPVKPAVIQAIKAVLCPELQGRGSVLGICVLLRLPFFARGVVVSGIFMSLSDVEQGKDGGVRHA